MPFEKKDKMRFQGFATIENERTIKLSLPPFFKLGKYWVEFNVRECASEEDFLEEEVSGSAGLEISNQNPSRFVSSSNIYNMVQYGYNQNAPVRFRVDFPFKDEPDLELPCLRVWVHSNVFDNHLQLTVLCFLPGVNIVHSGVLSHAEGFLHFAQQCENMLKSLDGPAVLGGGDDFQIALHGSKSNYIDTEIKISPNSAVHKHTVKIALHPDDLPPIISSCYRVARRFNATGA